jgi:hypothetical protein
LLAKPSPLNINLGSDRFSQMFNTKRDIPSAVQAALLQRGYYYEQDLEEPAGW